MDVNQTDRRLLEAQVAVLGSLLIEPAISGELISAVRAEDFTNALYRKIYDACRQVFFAKQLIDPVAVCSVIGADYSATLIEIMQVTPTAANWRVYAEIMREQATLSRIAGFAYEMASAVSLDDASALMDKLNQQFCSRQEARVVSFAQGLADFFARHDGRNPPQYLRWGLPALNKMLFAEPGDFVIIGGYPSAGKTVLAAQMAWEQARMNNKRVGIFSLETGAKKLYDRLICMAAQVPYEHIKHNSIDRDAWAQIADLGSIADGMPFDVIPASGMTVGDIRAIALSRHYDVIYIDYIQLIRSDTKFRGNRVEAVTEISMDLHIFAQTSGITVVGLSQLKRSDSAKKTPPTMSDLRESGQLEQDADIIMLLYLEDETVKTSDRRLKVDKNKEGECGYVTLGFDPQKMHLYQRSSRTDEPRPARSRFRDVPPEEAQQTLDMFPEPSKGGPA